MSESQFYKRHIILPLVGLKGQRKLKEASVLVVGAGGLGCPILQYLTAAGVGKITIIDHDTVDLSNLHRQILFRVDDVGRFKANCARNQLQKLNPYIQIEAISDAFTIDNAKLLCSQHDLVIDGTDNFTSKFLVSDVCYFLEKPTVYGSISQFDGQISLFNVPNADGVKTNLRDFYKAPPPSKYQSNCADAGVIGVLPGIIGTMMAAEAIKHILGIGSPLVGQILFFDSLGNESEKMKYCASPYNPLRGMDMKDLPDLHVEDSCSNTIVHEIDYTKAIEYLKRNKKAQLIDVRSVEEHNDQNLGGKNIPAAELNEYISTNKVIDVILYCLSGKRSRDAAESLIKTNDNLKISSLKGGILESGKFQV